MARNPYYAGPPSDHFDGERFFNPGQRSTDRSLGQLLRWQLGGGKARWSTPIAGPPPAKPAERVDGLAATMIGHASVLLQIEGRNLLIDPVWSDRASPLRWAGPKRALPPGVAFDDLPPIDAVLVTHNHYDHMDMATLRRLHVRHRPRFVTALGNDAIIARAVAGADLIALDWGDSVELGGMEVTAVPANHWSSRSLSDRRMALWCGFVVRGASHVIYDVGDTGYGDGRIFPEIARRFGPPDVALIPIGAYEPRWFMRDQHVDPEEAVRIMLACGAAQALGVHWGVFQLTDEDRLAPVLALAAALAEHGVEPSRFLALEPGQAWAKP